MKKIETGVTAEELVELTRTKPAIDQAHLARPVAHEYRTIPTEDLVLGFDAQLVHFEHRAFQDRREEAKIAYLALEEDLLENGLKSPLITFQGHVLVGMRRFEILCDFRASFPCVEITEDVSAWDSDDIDRLNEFKKIIFPDLERWIG